MQARLKLLPLPEWMTLLQKGDSGYRRNAFNAAIALCHAPELSRRIAFDTRRRQFVALDETPAGPKGPWTDDHTSELSTWLQGLRVPVKESDIITALSLIVRRYPIDPLGDWLSGLSDRWDGRERLSSWLATYCGAQDTPTNSLIGSKFLIGAVARALDPGCRMDYMLVLEGTQGLRKSTAVKILGGEFTAENLPDLHHKDAQQAASNAWFIEIGELAALRRSDIEQVKSFMSRTADTYRPPYGRHPITVKRWSVLVGNINPDGNPYLKDTTGNRRFWPVLVGEIQIDKLQRDREQIFAEAVYCYRRGDKWWVENTEQRDMLAAIQAEREENDDWQPIIAAWITSQVSVSNLTSWEIAHGALKIEEKDINRSVQTRIGICMKGLGYSKRRALNNPARPWVFERSE